MHSRLQKKDMRIRRRLVGKKEGISRSENGTREHNMTKMYSIHVCNFICIIPVGSENPFFF